MKASDLLKEDGYTRQKDGRYKALHYYSGKRAIAKEAALNRIVKSRGYKDYDSYQRTTRTREYRQWREWYREVNGTDAGFDELFTKAKKGRFKPRSQSLINLLRKTTFQPKEGYGWYHGGGWQEYGWGQYH